jgi:hypothetical protein
MLCMAASKAHSETTQILQDDSAATHRSWQATSKVSPLHAVSGMDPPSAQDLASLEVNTTVSCLPVCAYAGVERHPRRT